ncbi:MAG: hypothetical protein ACREOF_08195 [Gemmatimonadales bacterium]
MSGLLETIPSTPERSAGAGTDMVSLIIPVTERPEPLEELYREFTEPFRRAGRPFEALVVVQPWARALAAPLSHLGADEPIRVLETGQAAAETALIRLAASEARGSIMLILPAYRRVEPEGLLTLVEAVTQGADVATARRWPRRDPWINRLQNRAFHALLGGLSGSTLRDVASGVRAMRGEVLRELPLYGDFARFLPVVALREGYRVEEIPVPQHPRENRTRVYGPGIYLRRLIDLLGLFFLLRFTEKPLRFFGLLGSLLAFIGGVILVVVAVQRLEGQGLADRPLLLLGILVLVLGVQSIALGLIGEIIVHLHASRRVPYRLAQPAGATDRSTPSTGR